MRSIYIAAVVLLLTTGNASSAIIDDIKADMQNNEATLLNAPNVGWATKAYIGMGGASRGDATPAWWTPDNLTYKSSIGWGAITPWFVIYPGVGNTATNVRVKVYEILIHMLDKTTNKWVKLDTGLGKPAWANNFDFSLVTPLGAANTRIESDGNLSFKLSDGFYPIHGAFNRLDISQYIDPLNIAAVFVHVKTQLILDDPLGVDDRVSAQLLLDIGADYYPSMTTKLSDFSPMQYVPAVGGSRFGLVKTVPRNHYFATIDPPGPYSNTPFVQNGGAVAILETEFEANMPPYLNDTDTTAPTAPSSLTATVNTATTGKKKISSASIKLAWKVSTDNVGVVGYKIYRNGVMINSTSSLNYQDKIATSPTGSLYSYTIKAVDMAGNLSDSSNAALVVY